MYQSWLDFILLLDYNLSSNCQVSVEPSSPKASSVRKYIQTLESSFGIEADGSNSEGRVVSVGKDQVESRFVGVSGGRSVECYDGGVISSHEIVFVEFNFAGPGFGFFEFLVALLE